MGRGSGEPGAQSRGCGRELRHPPRDWDRGAQGGLTRSDLGCPACIFDSVTDRCFVGRLVGCGERKVWFEQLARGDFSTEKGRVRLERRRV